MAKNNKIISIEGNIGSGKSTLLANLKQYYKGHSDIVFVDEPVSEWETIVDPSDGKNMLEKFYKDKERYAFPFQMMAYISRLALLKEAYEKNEDCVIICERCLLTDKHVFAQMLYDDGKIEDINYQIYNKWFETFARDYPIDKFIYVNTDPTKCYERVGKRSRTGESDIPLDYLQNCHNYHEKMVEIYSNVFQIDGNVDINEKETQMTEWIESIDTVVVKNLRYNIKYDVLNLTSSDNIKEINEKVTDYSIPYVAVPNIQFSEENIEKESINCTSICDCGDY